MILDEALEVRPRGAGVVETGTGTPARTLVFHVERTAQQLLQMRLTDAADPFFLLALALGDDDFRRLRAAQALLVDFASFPRMLQRLVDDVREGRGVAELAELSGSSSSSLEFVEYTSWRKTTHLALEFRAATDEAVKAYLAGRWAEERALRGKAEAAAAAESARADAAEQRCRDAAASHDAAVAAAAARAQAESATLQARLEESASAVRTLKEAKERLSGELQSALAQLATTRTQLSQRDAELAAAEQRAAESAKAATAAAEQRAVQSSKAATVAAEERAAQLKREIHKGNEVIAKMQEKLLSLHSQVKERAEDAARRDATLSALQRELDECRGRLGAAEGDNAKLRGECEALRVKSDAQQAEIERGATRIDFLSRQLAGAHIATARRTQRPQDEI